MRGDVYRAAWQMARKRQLPTNFAIAGKVSNARILGTIAAESYSEYLLREKNPPQRETIIRQRLEVSPWRIW
jgi:hypothetical protein